MIRKIKYGLMYINKYGIKRAFTVIYIYKIDVLIRKIFMVFLKKQPLRDIIIIESHNDFDCNGGAFYDYLIKNSYNEVYKVVWALKNREKRRLEKNVDSFQLYKPGLKKNYYICMAKYFLSDNSIIDKMRNEQISIYCCHGAISLKETRGLCNVPDFVDYVLSPSKNYDQILSWELSMPFPNNKMIHLGYPSEDIYFSNKDDEFKKIINKKYIKKILWMPTLRKGGGYMRNDSHVTYKFGIPLIENEDDFNKLSNLLNKLDVLLVIKLHPMQDLNSVSIIKSTENLIIITEPVVKQLDLDNYKLMSSADVLISDYSASAFSFLLLNRPLGFVLTDLSEYKLGLCVENVEDYLVGHKIYMYEDLIKFINDVRYDNDIYSDKRSDLIRWLYKYQDGDSSKRLAEFLELRHAN